MGPPTEEDVYTNGQTLWYEEQTGIHVEEWTIVVEEAETQFNLSIASGEYPDIYFNTFTSEQVMLNVDGGVFAPLNDLIETSGPNFKGLLDTNQWMVDGLTAPDGNIYTFFRTDSGVHMNSQNKMYMYQPFLDNLGLDAPTTTQEFKDTLIAFRDQDANGNGDPNDEIPLSGASISGLDPIAYLMNPFQLWSYSNDFLIAQDGKVSFIANTDGFRDGLRYINDLFNEDLLAEETYVQDNTQFSAVLSQPTKGEMRIATWPTNVPVFFIDFNTLEDAIIDLLPLSPLEGPTGLRQADAKTNRLDLYGTITTSCENKEVAMRWIDGLLGEPAHSVNFYGFEDINYTLVDEPAITGAIPSRVRNLDEETMKNTTWNNFVFGPIFDTVELRYGSKDVVGDFPWMFMWAHNNYEPYYVDSGFPLVSWSTDADMSVEFAELKILFEDYVKQAYTQYILGSRDINDDGDWQAYLDELDAMGVDRYVQISQEINFGK